MGRLARAWNALTGKTPVAPTTEIGYSTEANRIYNSLWADDWEETPELRWPKSVKTYDKMRRQDSQVKSVLKAVTLPILATGWYVEQNGSTPEIAQFVANELGIPVHGSPAPTPTRERDRFSIQDHLRLALTELVFGHSIFEQVYRLGEDGLFHLRKLAWRAPWTIEKFNVAPDGGLVSIEQKTSSLSETRPVIPISRLVAYVNEREGGRWEGQSAIRPAYKDWILKDLLLRVQTQSAERNGMGIAVYTGAPVPDFGDEEQMKLAAEADLEAGRALAMSLRSGDAAGAAIPHEAQLSLTGVSGKLPDIDPIIRYHDEQIARSVLAHFLNLGTETGSWALGSTFADFFAQSLQAIAVTLAETFTAHVIEDLVDVNFGTEVLSPRLGFDEIGAKHMPSANDIAMLVNAGVIWKGPVLEQYVRTLFGIEPEEATNGA